MSNEYLPSDHFNENHQPNNRLSPLASSIPRIPSPNEGSQFANLRLSNHNIFYEDFDSWNGNSSNNLSERHNIYFNQPNNNSLPPLHISPSVGMPLWNTGLQNLQPQVLLGYNFLTNIDSGNGVVLNNLSEEYNFPCNHPNNNFEPLNRSPVIGERCFIWHTKTTVYYYCLIPRIRILTQVDCAKWFCQFEVWCAPQNGGYTTTQTTSDILWLMVILW